MKMIERINIHNLFLYITERCNLDCEYCYFKYKKNGCNLDFSAIIELIGLINTHPGRDNIRFIISGGEPILSWETLQKTVHYLRDKFKTNHIHIQTNGTLLDKKKLNFLKDYRVGIEFGIDGGFYSSSSYRRGLNPGRFKTLCRNIRYAVKIKSPLSATMTVPHEQIGRMPANLAYLIKLGLRNIDITPAAFTRWKGNDISDFKKEYTRIIKKTALVHKNILSMGEDSPLNEYSWDISMNPGGQVLPGDVYLCLSQKKKRQYSIMSINKNKILYNYDNFNFYLKEYANYHSPLSKNNVCHRDFIISSFYILNKVINNKRYSLGCKNIIDLLSFLRKTNKTIIDIKSGKREFHRV